MHILISGAGIGGLTAALCLIQKGYSVTVFEQASKLSEIGAGLQLSPNAMRVMIALDLHQELLRLGFEPEFAELRWGQSGRTIFQIPLREYAVARWGAPYLNIHRADLVAVLARALEARAPGRLKLGRSLTGYAQTARNITATLDGEREKNGDVLIGADGLHSVVRRQMLGPDAPRFTGCLAWRATAPLDALGDAAPPPSAIAWVGSGKHAVTYRVRGGRVANFVGVIEDAEQIGEAWTQTGCAEHALRDFEGWHPMVTSVLDHAETVHRWALFDRAPLPRWTEGRACLLGDACHPMLPFMAQGAAMAIEDAYVLADRLNRIETVPRALIAYEETRKHRTSKVQAASRNNKNIFHRRSAIGRLGTYGPMALANTVAPAFISAKQSWIYGHNVTA